MVIINTDKYLDKAVLVEEIITYLGYSDKNITIILENDPEASQQFVRKILRDAKGIYFYRPHGIEECAPISVVTALENPKNLHVIWISEGVCTESAIEFCWISAHELQHLRQREQYPDIVTWDRELLNRYKSNINTKTYTQEDLPSELDANIFAKDYCILKFGYELTKSYIDNEMIKTRPELSKSILQKEKFNLTDRYNYLLNNNKEKDK